MNEPTQTTRDQLEAYLDGLLDDAQRAAVEAAIEQDPALRAAVKLQAKIDASLARMFRSAAPSERSAAAMLAGAAPSAAATLPWGRLAWLGAGLAAAAALVWAIVGGPLGGFSDRGPQFAARPLADVYREAVANGFEADYACSEAERFADTFERRQGTPLKLLKLPVGTRMLGLSYPGGLSRDTTAMLCRVDGQPVMLFVDRLAADQSLAVAHSDKSVRVFRKERDGLVFYEVTPLDGPRVTDYVAPLSAPGASELPARKSAA